MENTQLYEKLHVARLAIRAQITDPGQIEELAHDLRRAGRYHYAGELYGLLLKGGGDAGRRKYWNKHLAFCIYKDPDQPSASKYDAALHYLRQAVPLESTRDAEFLGTAGAIYKRKWQYDNHFQNLIFSEHYYREGYFSWQKRNGDLGKISEGDLEGKDDRGYTAINFAFVADLIAFVRLREVGDLKNTEMSKSALDRLKKAAETRRYIITKLLGADFVRFPENPAGTLGDDLGTWELTTVAEAYFGIGEYAGAEFFFRKYRGQNLDVWQAHTTAEQLMRLAEIQSQIGLRLGGISAHPDLSVFDKNIIFEAARTCLRALHPNAEPPDDKTLSIAFGGKVGLALSGGGFRAALFHVGVFARLAELDLLRHVEVLSCVSGGSIVGAYYYMLLKREMERHGEAMSQMHYIHIVREMEATFLSACQKNLRMRIFLNPWDNLRIFFQKDYTRSHRLGELYEKHLYRKIIQNTHPEGKPILMHTLRIRPADVPDGQDFNLKTENWNRRNKVPILVLNATSLNTGHNWQFTASWMGEPPGNIKQDVDAKPRLRRMYYHEAPAPYKNNIRLGHAVGASSCVPVLFEPLLMKNLYPDIDLELVDGGVHDNQGIASLLEQECKVLIVSDASGQLGDTTTASGGSAGVFFRSDSVLQERVRESQLLDLKERENSAQVTAMMFVHLKKELGKDPVNWNTCEEPERTIATPETARRDPDLTKYGIRRAVQTGLAELRTDLDAFNDAEAYALMYSGYAQTRHEMRHPKFEYLTSEVSPQSWNFLDIQDRMRHVAPSESLLRRLQLGASLPLKAFKTSWLWTFIGVSLGVVLFAGLIYVIYDTFWGKSYTFGLTGETVQTIGLVILG
ncbi:MAG: patatin-like phospholipase family protein, partial [Saprospiraceae bacterium]|nr:patatin-like phospholipase family protein [Saprospiraceae bacterium]